AQQAAKDARAAADRADTAATEAEQAAKDAEKYAKEAQEAIEVAQRNAANQQIKSGAGTGTGGVFYVVDESSMEITDAKQHEPCEIEAGLGGCTVTFTVTFNVRADFFLCTNPDVPATVNGCPPGDTVLLIDNKLFTGLKKDVTKYFTKLEIIQQTLTYQILKAVLVQDFIDCWHGSASACAWAASNFIPGKAFEKAGEVIRALDAALKTGIGVADAFKALKALDLDPAALAKLESTVNAYEDLVVSCRLNSFTADTRVLMADGTRRPIASVRPGEYVMATDTRTGTLRPQPVTDTFQHPATRLLTIGLEGGASLDTTPGHRVRAKGRGWIVASDLRVGDALFGPDGGIREVTALHDRSGLEARRVYDLTVDTLHNFYVSGEGKRPADVLVHNCINLGDEKLPSLRAYEDEIHTLKEHVDADAAEAFRLAAKKGKPNSVWTNGEIAQQAVDRVISDYFHKRNASGQLVLDEGKWNAFERWKAKAKDGEQYPVTITGTWGEYRSLGKAYHPDGRTITDVGNEVVVILMKVRGHTGKGRGGYVVKTAYPSGTP
ncbi:polymorphic toxin-type HINT domain-containing protein, partial [Streptomyces sp. NPDC001941]|uniref:polymorphic toxin-type HINT domain-containing protein n=1 Tax=Streptomyces sp. NPDC001941 TaxID=3154659 RepID=UPI00332D6A81